VEVSDNRSGIAPKIQSQLSIRSSLPKQWAKARAWGSISCINRATAVESRAGAIGCPIPVANGEKAMMFWLLDWSDYRDGIGAAITADFTDPYSVGRSRSSPVPFDLVTSSTPPVDQLGREMTCRRKLPYPQRRPGSRSPVQRCRCLSMAEILIRSWDRRD
jgi:hypothetical protein